MLPLSRNEALSPKARDLAAQLRKFWNVDFDDSLKRVTCSKCLVAWDSALERSANNPHDAVRLLAKEARFT